MTWRSIKDDPPPKDGTPVDLWGYDAGGQRRAANASWGPYLDWLQREKEGWRTGQVDEFVPTHWMPLPEPPEAPHD